MAADTGTMNRTKSIDALWTRALDLLWQGFEHSLDPRPNSRALKLRWRREFGSLIAELRRRGEDTDGLAWPGR